MKKRTTLPRSCIASISLAILIFVCSCTLIITAPVNPVAHRLLANHDLLSGYTCIDHTGQMRYLPFGEVCSGNERTGPSKHVDVLLPNAANLVRPIYYRLRGIDP